MIPAQLALTLLFLLIAPVARASLSVQIEPLAFFRSGYNVEVALKINHWRYGVSLLKDQSPEMISEQGTLEIESKVLGAHLDYFPGAAEGAADGWYLGPSFHRVRWTFRHPASGVERKRETDFIGPQVGYVYRPGKGGGFFMEFALAYERNINSKSDIIVSGETNEIPDQVFVPAVVFGYSF